MAIDMRLSDYAKQQGVCYMTAYRWYKAGRIPEAYTSPSGLVYVRDKVVAENQEKTIVYCRVSSSQDKSNLETQAQRVCAFCAAKGWQVNEVVKEVGSGLNDSRKGLLKVLSDGKATRIVVEHKDRLTRFGFNYIKTLFKGEIVVINEATEDKEDLMSDFTSVITSFCARVYGLRRNRRRTEKILEELKKEKE